MNSNSGHDNIDILAPMHIINDYSSEDSLHLGNYIDAPTKAMMFKDKSDIIRKIDTLTFSSSQTVRSIVFPKNLKDVVFYIPQVNLYTIDSSLHLNCESDLYEFATPEAINKLSYANLEDQTPGTLTDKPMCLIFMVCFAIRYNPDEWDELCESMPEFARHIFDTLKIDVFKFIRHNSLNEISVSNWIQHQDYKIEIEAEHLLTNAALLDR